MYSEVVLSTHMFIKKSELKSLSAAKRKMTATSTYDAIEYPMFVERPNLFGIPLYFYPYWFKVAKKVHDLRADGSKINIKFTSKIRVGQDEVMRDFKVGLGMGKTGFRLEAPPGFGKTVVVLAMLAILKRSALIVVPRSNLVDQWVERIAEHTDYPVNRIGVINGDIVKWEGYPITVALVHSIAARMTDNHSFHESFGVAVFDEVDRSVPPSTFSPILGLLPAKFRIGASATVKRKDGLHLISDSHIAQVKLKGRDVGRMTPKILIVRYSKSSGGLYMGGPKLNRRGMLLSKLAENPLRNQLICKYAKLIYKSGRRFIILSDRTAQLADLYWMLTRQGVKPIEMGFYCDSIATTKTGKKRKVKKEELERVASDCKILLGTYGKIAIGTDIPDLAGLIYATPQSDVRQTQGRIERMCEGKSQPVVVDIVDLAYPDAIGWSKARRRYYNQKGLTIKVI